MSQLPSPMDPALEQRSEPVLGSSLALRGGALVPHGGLAEVLLHALAFGEAQRGKPEVAFPINQEEDAFFPRLECPSYLAYEVVRAGNRLLRHFPHDVTGKQALFGGRAAGNKRGQAPLSARGLSNEQTGESDGSEDPWRRQTAPAGLRGTRSRHHRAVSAPPRCDSRRRQRVSRHCDRRCRVRCCARRSRSPAARAPSCRSACTGRWPTWPS